MRARAYSVCFVRYSNRIYRFRFVVVVVAVVAVHCVFICTVLVFCFAHIVVDCFYQHAVGSERSIFNGCNMDTFCVRPKKQMRLGRGPKNEEKRSENGQVKMNGVWCKFKYLWGLNLARRERKEKGCKRKG